MEVWLIVILHQIIFQGMFVAKNILLARKTGEQIRGKNKEATISIVFFAVFIAFTIVFSFFGVSIGNVEMISQNYGTVIGIVLLAINIAVSLVSLADLKDSWRVGVLEDQKTELISSGIYRFTRNPYFLSYLFMFAAYTVLLQNLILLVLSLVGFILIHKMILKEEAYLSLIHGSSYRQYINKVPRYIFI